MSLPVNHDLPIANGALPSQVVGAGAPAGFWGRLRGIGGSVKGAAAAVSNRVSSAASTVKGAWQATKVAAGVARDIGSFSYNVLAPAAGDAMKNAAAGGRIQRR